jgi:hypothetical protein
MIYKFISTKSFDGLSNRDNPDNEYFRQSAVDLAHVDIALGADRIAVSEKPLCLTSLFFKNVRVIRYMNDDHSLADGDYRDFLQIGTGNRVAVDDALDRAYCAVIRRTTANNQAGRIELRGALREVDVVRSPSGVLSIAPAAAGNLAAAFGSFQANMNSFPLAGTWVMIQPRMKRQLAARQITSFQLAGVKHRQVTVQKTSLQSARVKLIQREINNLKSQARRFQRQVELGLLTLAGIIGTLQNIWDASRLLLEGIPLALRGLIQLGPFLGAARPALGA